MAIINKNLTLAENQAITANAISDNVIQWNPMGTVPGESGPRARNLGSGAPIPLLLQITETFNNLTSLTVELISAATADLTGTPDVLSTTVLQAADLVEGKNLPSPQIMPDAPLQDYFGVRFTVTGTAPTTGRITCVVGTESEDS